MKIRLSQLIILIMLMPAIGQAQDLNSRILMTVGGRNTEAGEFIRMYRKSLEPGKPLSVDEYLTQFTLFKLKVADAMSEGFDTTRAFRDELEGYRNQLAQNYLTDTLTKEKLLEKAYQRSLKEINVWHILVSMPQNALPADTLKAWKKALEIRVRIFQGETFEMVARSTSDDQSVRINGGNLGYITVFQMIMPFEDAVYSMKKGAVSMPVRTPYGYHIIKVADIRPSRGRIEVAHIMKNASPGASEAEVKKAEEDINLIYKKLESGEPFGELAKKYSDHKESAAKGGVLNWFGTGEMIPDFSEAAFSISDTGRYTKPVRTMYGWHIIKLLNRRPPGSLNDTRSYLESRINQSYLNSLSKKSFVEKLKKEYKFRINKVSYDWFVNNTDSLIIRGLKKYNRSEILDGIIYSFTSKVFKNIEFADYIEKKCSMILTNDPANFIKILLDNNASDQLIAIENASLEVKHPEFRYLMNEFHDGILLFDISGVKIWDRIVSDSTGLHKYYEEHKYDYVSKREINAKIYTLKIPGGNEILASAYKKYAGKPDADRRLLEKFNRNNDTALFIQTGTWKSGDDPELDKVEWVPGTHSLTREGLPSLIQINKVTDPLPLEFEYVVDKMMNGYQEYLDSEWKIQLNEKYNVLIDSFVLGEVKKRLNNE
jgi:peptidyl-prolyl cis-trans isomerase SurA